MTEHQARATVARWRRIRRKDTNTKMTRAGANWCVHALCGCGFPTVAARIAGYQFRADNVGIEFWSGQAKGTSRTIQIGRKLQTVQL